MDYGFYVLSCLMAFRVQGIRGIGFTNPPNRAIVAGDSVEFLCAALNQPPELTTFVAYDECITRPRPACRGISVDDRLVYTENGGDPARAARYSIRRGNNDLFILNITDTVLDDAGTYRCSALNAEYVAYNELILFDGEPRCTRNTTNENEAVQGEFIRHVCEGPYRGRWGPRMRFHATQRDPWLLFIEDEPKNDSESGIARYSVTLEMAPKHNGAVFEVDVYFGTQRSEEAHVTTLGPYYRFQYNFEPLTVSYPPVDITLLWDRRKSCLNVGQIVTCETTANPPPTFEWRDVATGQIVGNNATLEVTQSMLGTGSYSCRVQNELGNEEKVADLEFCNKRPPLTEAPSTAATMDTSPTMSSGQRSLRHQSLVSALVVGIGLISRVVTLVASGPAG